MVAGQIYIVWGRRGDCIGTKYADDGAGFNGRASPISFTY
jgi:hypothetical protein